MSTKYIGEKMTRNAIAAILTLAKGAQRYTSKEVVAILQSDHPPAYIRKTLYRLRRQQYLGGGAVEGYELTHKGAMRLAKLQFEELVQIGEWDKTWRLVIYDIPEANRAARNKVRQLIKKLGFIQLQQSVWAHPLPCLQELKLIRDSYGVSEHLLLLDTPHNENYYKLLKKFQKKYPGIKC